MTFQPDLFAGKVAFVAGASSGINLRIAQRFAEAGAKVMIISRSEDKIAAAAKTITDAGHEATGRSCDVRDSAKVAAALKHCHDTYGPIDILLSGAAGNFLAPAIGMSANAFKTVIDIDLLGTFNVLHESFPYLKKPGASLISITAGQAVKPMMFQIHACAAKAGVNQVTKCLAMEWGPAGIRVNAVCPGPIGDTEGMSRLAPSAAAAEASKQRIPLRDWGTKDGIADACLWHRKRCSASCYRRHHQCRRRLGIRRRRCGCAYGSRPLVRLGLIGRYCVNGSMNGAALGG